jgi:protein pelota
LENPDDFWYLSNLIEEGNIIKGSTERKIKIGSSEDRKSDATKKRVFLAIDVEKKELTESSLRISGKINEAPDDIPKGDYHTFNLESGDTITIVKKEWLKYQKDKLHEACIDKGTKILVLVFDRESAYFALSKKYGYEILLKLEGDVQKKGDETSKESKFYSEIIKKLKEYDERYKTQNIIIASPSFWKEYLLNEVNDDELKKKFILATSSSADETALNEVLKRPEIKKAIQNDKAAKDLNLIEDILKEISKSGLVAYGIGEVKKCAEMGNISKLIISDGLIGKMRSEEIFIELENIMKLIEKTGADIIIVSSENDAGKQLDGLTGIAALLRYKI